MIAKTNPFKLLGPLGDSKEPSNLRRFTLTNNTGAESHGSACPQSFIELLCQLQRCVEDTHDLPRASTPQPAFSNVTTFFSDASFTPRLPVNFLPLSQSVYSEHSDAQGVREQANGGTQQQNLPIIQLGTNKTGYPTTVQSDAILRAHQTLRTESPAHESNAHIHQALYGHRDTIHRFEAGHAGHQTHEVTRFRENNVTIRSNVETRTGAFDTYKGAEDSFLYNTAGDARETRKDSMVPTSSHVHGTEPQRTGVMLHTPSVLMTGRQKTQGVSDQSFSPSNSDRTDMTIDRGIKLGTAEESLRAVLHTAHHGSGKTQVFPTFETLDGTAGEQVPRDHSTAKMRQYNPVLHSEVTANSLNQALDKMLSGHGVQQSPLNTQAKRNTGAQPESVVETSARTNSPVMEFSRMGLDTLVRALSMRMNQDVSEIRFRVKPEHLGELVVKVRMEGGKLAAQAEVAHPAVKAALEQQLPQLRELLSSRGIDLERFDVHAEREGERGNEKKERTMDHARDGDREDSSISGGTGSNGTRSLGYNTIELIF